MGICCCLRQIIIREEYDPIESVHETTGVNSEQEAARNINEGIRALKVMDYARAVSCAEKVIIWSRPRNLEIHFTAHSLLLICMNYLLQEKYGKGISYLEEYKKTIAHFNVENIHPEIRSQRVICETLLNIEFYHDFPEAEKIIKEDIKHIYNEQQPQDYDGNLDIIASHFFNLVIVNTDSNTLHWVVKQVDQLFLHAKYYEYPTVFFIRARYNIELGNYQRALILLEGMDEALKNHAEIHMGYASLYYYRAICYAPLYLFEEAKQNMKLLKQRTHQVPLLQRNLYFAKADYLNRTKKYEKCIGLCKEAKDKKVPQVIEGCWDFFISSSKLQLMTIENASRMRFDKGWVYDLGHQNFLGNIASKIIEIMYMEQSKHIKSLLKTYRDLVEQRQKCPENIISLIEEQAILGTLELGSGEFAKALCSLKNAIHIAKTCDLFGKYVTDHKYSLVYFEQFSNLYGARVLASFICDINNKQTPDAFQSFAFADSGKAILFLHKLKFDFIEIPLGIIQQIAREKNVLAYHIVDLGSTKILFRWLLTPKQALFDEEMVKALADSESEELIIVPHRELYLVNFAEFVLNNIQLIDKFYIRYVPSLFSYFLLLLRKEKKQDYLHSALLIGNPVMPPKWNDLPGAEKELLNSEKMLRDCRIKVVVKTQHSATRAAFLEEAPNAQLLMISTHGEAKEFPKGSNHFGSLVLKDGNLLSSEIMDLDLNAFVTVLNCCHSADGSPTADGMIGLVRSFLLAGSDAVIAPHRKVSDVTSNNLMKHFIDNLVESSPFKAFNVAQRTLKQNNVTGWFQYKFFGV